ncbi:MAG: DNA cytosine methyltransferase [Bacteroidales bacterium]|nr:DNA cytosine methyltransferase [Bacteroidales bacterium]
MGFNKNIFNLTHLINNSKNIYNLNFPLISPKYHDAKKRYNWPKQNKFGEIPVLDELIPIELTVINCLVNEKDRKNKVANIDEHFPLKRNIEEKKLINEGDTNRPSFKRLHRYRYSPTTCYGNNEVHLHPYENRRISVREALRIQGVPDSYEFSKDLSLTKKFKLVGNGVPVPLARVVAESVLNLINDKNLLIAL